MILNLNPSSIADYHTFLRVKSLPVYRIRGREAWFPDDYAERLGLAIPQSGDVHYDPSPFCHDYQSGIASIALQKKRFAVFADCGRGKTIIYFEWLKAILPLLAAQGRGALIISPLMVIDQTIEEANRWYGDSLPIEQVDSSDLNSWLATCGGKIGITNYEALRGDIDRGQLGALVIDESSLLKSHYGKYGQAVIGLGRELKDEYFAAAQKNLRRAVKLSSDQVQMPLLAAAIA